MSKEPKLTNAVASIWGGNVIAPTFVQIGSVALETAGDEINAMSNSNRKYRRTGGRELISEDFLMELRPPNSKDILPVCNSSSAVGQSDREPVGCRIRRLAG